MISIDFEAFDEAINSLKYEFDWECYLDKQTGKIELLDVQENEDVINEDDSSYSKYIINREPKQAVEEKEVNEQDILWELLDNTSTIVRRIQRRTFFAIILE